MKHTMNKFLKTVIINVLRNPFSSCSYPQFISLIYCKLTLSLIGVRLLIHSLHTETNTLIQKITKSCIYYTQI